MGLTFRPRFDCAICPTRCDGRSKSAYVFEDDVALSEAAEDWLAGHLGDALDVDVYKAPARRHGLPDLALIQGGRVLARSDYVDGEHKGVVVNYHFSLKELLPLEALVEQMAGL